VTPCLWVVLLDVLKVPTTCILRVTDGSEHSDTPSGATRSTSCITPRWILQISHTFIKLNIIGLFFILDYKKLVRGKGKGKDHPRKGHEGPERE